MIQIDKAIKQIQFVGMHIDPDSDTGRAYDLAIRSLEAWKKVEKEICKRQHSGVFSEDILIGLVMARNIITKALEVEEQEHACCYWDASVNGCTLGNHHCPNSYDCEDFD